MAVEIRELIIKTEISITGKNRQSEATSEKELELLKANLMDDCKRIIAEYIRKNYYKR